MFQTNEIIMKIANIVTDTKITVSNDFNVVPSIQYITKGLPTLIVGYDIVSKLYPDFNILEIELSNNLYWTFKRTEKRDKFEEDLLWFIGRVYEELVKDIKYVFVDPIHYTPRALIKIIKKIKSLDKPITYVKDRMVYIYGDNLIFGIDLRLLKFIGYDTEKIKNKIKKLSSVFLEGSSVFIEYKKHVHALNNQIRYIPYLYKVIYGEKKVNNLIHST